MKRSLLAILIWGACSVFAESPNLTRRAWCRFTLAKLGLAMSAVGVGTAWYFRTWEGAGVYASRRERELLEKEFSSYRSKQELEQDLKVLAPYLVQVLAADKHYWEYNWIIRERRDLSQYCVGDALLGRISAPDQWAPGQKRAIVRKWKDRASGFGVVLPSPDDIARANEKYAIQYDSWFSSALAAHEMGAYQRSRGPGLEVFLVGFLTDYLWASPECQWNDLATALQVTSSHPGSNYPTERDKRVREFEELIHVKKIRELFRAD